MGKLFGRKPRSAPESGASPQDQEKEVPQPEASPTFGLKFILETGETHTFTSLPIAIGRSEDNALVLKDETVSAIHAWVKYDEAARSVCILDHDSLNGLYVNDQPTRKNILYDGALIRLGNARLTFRDTGYIHSS
jgi:pSer/pThr/pTyr-binding forkhead associated (FHA) protein